MKTVIIYDTKYGSTLQAATIIASILDDAKLVAIDKFNEFNGICDVVILGGHVYMGLVNRRLVDFVKKNEAWLRTKKIYSYVMMLEGDWGAKYLVPIKDILGDDLLSMQSFGGRLKVDDLDEQDLQDIKKLMKDLHMPVHDINMFEKESIETYARNLKQDIEESRFQLTEDMIFKLIEQQLVNQKRGILGTVNEGEVSLKGVDYVYHQYYIYLRQIKQLPVALHMGQAISLLILNDQDSFVLNSDILISGDVVSVEDASSSTWYRIKIKELKLEDEEKNTVQCIRYSYC